MLSEKVLFFKEVVVVEVKPKKKKADKKKGKGGKKNDDDDIDALLAEIEKPSETQEPEEKKGMITNPPQKSGYDIIALSDHRPIYKLIQWTSLKQ